MRKKTWKVSSQIVSNPLKVNHITFKIAIPYDCPIDAALKKK